MMKRQYVRPQMLTVRLRPSSLICNSLFDSVTVKPNEVMTENEDFE
jgi:hypothetical protein